MRQWRALISAGLLLAVSCKSVRGCSCVEIFVSDRAEAAREFLGCPYTAVFWIAKEGSRFEAALSTGFPPALAARCSASVAAFLMR